MDTNTSSQPIQLSKTNRQKTRHSLLLGAVLLIMSIVGSACSCGAPYPPMDSSAIWKDVKDKYRSWKRAPGFPGREKSENVHGDEVDIFVNDVVQKALDDKKPITQWPVGSIVMKDGFKGGKLSLVSWMKKLDDGWVWIEWDDKGKALYEGRPNICTGCHSSGADYVRAFSFPK